MIENEHRQKEYNLLVKHGMPTVIAASIANQIDSFGYSEIHYILKMKQTPFLHGAVMWFQNWDETVEGFEFWEALNHDMFLRGV